MQKHTVMGQSIAKADGMERVVGSARYGADVSLPGMLHGKILRSPHAHARILHIDSSKAVKLPGVVAVVTAGDLRGERPVEPTPQHAAGESADAGHEEESRTDSRPNAGRTVFAGAKALWAGQAVAAVAATSPEIAEQALELIDVTYEVLEPLLSAEDAMRPDAPLLHPNLFTESLGGKSDKPSNIATYIEHSRGDLEEGFKKADVILEDTYRTGMVHQGYLEPRATLARMDPDGNLTVWSSSQGSFSIQQQVAEILRLPPTRVNIIPMELGGGFGSKTQGILEPIASLLAIKTGRPVKMVMARDEEFKAGRPASPSVLHLKMGAKRDGTLVAAHVKVIMDGGAFPGGPVASATSMGLGTYKMPIARVEGYDVVTNKPPVGAYRAPGAPQSVYAVEQHMDRLAQMLGMDPIEFRLKNIAQEGDRLPDDSRHPRVGFRETLEIVKRHPIWNSPPKGANRGRGFACGMWMGGIQPASCTLKLDGDGSLALIMGYVDMTGIRTAFKQIVADEFEVSSDQVTVNILDTDTAPYAPSATGSKATFIMSIAIKQACDAVKKQLLEKAAARLDLPLDQVEYGAGRIYSKSDHDRAIALKELGQRGVTGKGGSIIGTGTGSSSRAREAPAFAADVVDVEVDPETGKVTVLGFWAFQDCGFAVNPQQIEGQMQGGVTQGIGWALTEEYYFSQEGVLRNPTFLDYRMPTSLDLPFIDTTIVEVPNSEGPYGIKGVGEMGIVPPMAAMANAIAHATGVRLTELPMSPERVFFALKAHREGNGR